MDISHPGHVASKIPPAKINQSPSKQYLCEDHSEEGPGGMPLQEAASTTSSRGINSQISPSQKSTSTRFLNAEGPTSPEGDKGLVLFQDFVN